MRKNLLLVSLLSGAILFTSFLHAQIDRFAYAVTDVEISGSNWNYLRKLNFQTGEYSNVLLNGNDASLLAYDAGSKKQFTSLLNDAHWGTKINAAFSTGVAAMAYDKNNNRLYYTPMFIDQLRYVDLKTMKVYFVTDQTLTGMPEKSPDQGNVVTRMVIASDGNGYAMTNDATHFIQFNIGRKSNITDLGTLVDDPANKNTSVHNSCSSYGGDMVADDNGNLYIFSARNNVFKVNIANRVATHLGVITGLPSGFTTNAAAVNDKNQILVGSALQTFSYFMVDPKTLAATAYNIKGQVWHSSDMANSNVLKSGNKPVDIIQEILTSAVTNTGDNRIQIYPNPVINNKFIVQFKQLDPGNYTIQLLDVSGRQVQQKLINISGENQT
ncbi:MAG: T9SS type A sorting domain-containing protein, partial [Bacteroidia bacterium]|nr:T9SS type A sorting domain-containing protein [Bacteroidia bacterium]